MDRLCEACGATFVAKRDARRFCSDRCRKRAKRTEVRGDVVVALPAPADAVATAGEIEAALAATLTDQSTPSARLALRLARDVDGMTALSPTYVHVVKELRASLVALGAAPAAKTSGKAKATGTGGKVAQFRARRETATGS